MLISQDHQEPLHAFLVIFHLVKHIQVILYAKHAIWDLLEPQVQYVHLELQIVNNSLQKLFAKHAKIILNYQQILQNV